MTRGIHLVFNTKTGVVDSNLFLTADFHVDLAYRLVESGIYGTMAKKHWSFAVMTAKTIESMLPMYRKVEKDGLTRYQPRVAASATRGSFASLLLVLETLAEHAEERSKLELKGEQLGDQYGPKPDATGRGRESEVPAQESSPGKPGFEILTLSDGSSLSVMEWEQIDAAEAAALFPEIIPEQVADHSNVTKRRMEDALQDGEADSNVGQA